MTLEIAGVWDIECAGWDRFLCGQMTSIDGETFQTWDEDEFFAAMISQSGNWYAHVGGRYDGLWFLDMCCRHKLEWNAKMRGSGVLTARMGDLEIRDSFALVPMRLKKFAPLGEYEKCELGLPCECGRDCGGYCVFERDMSDAERRLTLEYLDLDCKALLSALDALEYRASLHDITLKLTVGSSAWNTAKRWYDLPTCRHDLGRYTALREGYYGGRTEVFRTRAESGHRYDIHSSYPAALARTPLPIGEGQAYNGYLASGHLESGKEGIFTAEVVVPDCEIPPLPVRAGDRLLYPTGPISGTWTGLELRYAMEQGAKVEKVTRAYVWADSSPVLAPFAERVWAIRDKSAAGGKSDQVFAAWTKWVANSLTGKLAQRPEHNALAFEAGEDGCAPEVTPGDDDSSPPIDVIACVHGGAFVITTRSRVDACAHVQWSAYLTSEARIELHRQLTHAHVAYYCDTDSVYSRDVLTRRVGPKLGEWGYEGSLRNWRALAPKVYSYEDEKGKAHVKGKGLSGLDAVGFAALERGEPWTIDQGVYGLRSAIRMGEPNGKPRKVAGLFARRTLSRMLCPIPGWVGGRELEADNVRTRPTTVERYNGAQRQCAVAYAKALQRQKRKEYVDRRENSL